MSEIKHEYNCINCQKSFETRCELCKGIKKDFREYYKLLTIKEEN